MGGTIKTASVVQRAICYRSDLLQYDRPWQVYERYDVTPDGPTLELALLVDSEACARSLPSPLRKMAHYDFPYARSPRGQFRYHTARVEVR